MTTKKKPAPLTKEELRILKKSYKPRTGMDIAKKILIDATVAGVGLCGMLASAHALEKEFRKENGDRIDKERGFKEYAKIAALGTGYGVSAAVTVVSSFDLGMSSMEGWLKMCEEDTK